MGNYFVRETADYVDGVVSAENALVPDAAFILENRERKRALFFLEMDMATERIVSTNLRETAQAFTTNLSSTTAISTACVMHRNTKTLEILATLPCCLSPLERSAFKTSAQKCRIYLLSLPTTAVSPHLIKQWAIFSRKLAIHLSDTAVYPLVRGGGVVALKNPVASCSRAAMVPPISTIFLSRLG